MRSILRLSWALAVLWSATASAQFANRSLGLSVGYSQFQNEFSFEWAVPISLEASVYIENGFDLTVRAPMMIIYQVNKHIVSAGANLGVRYLISEEALRPYLGAEMAFIYIFAVQTNPAFFGIGPHGGVDYFVSDSVTIGARAFFNLYMMLNVSPMTTYGLQGVVATYF